MTSIETEPQKLRLPRIFRPVINPEAATVFNEHAHRQYGRKIEPVKTGRLWLELLLLKELQLSSPLSEDAIARLHSNLLEMPVTFDQEVSLSGLVLSSQRATSAKNRAVLVATFIPPYSLVAERHFICEVVKDATGLDLDGPLSTVAAANSTTEYSWMVALAHTVPNGVHTLHRAEIEKNLRSSVPTDFLLGSGIID